MSLFDTLPNELLVAILDNAPHHELFATSMVCKRWHFGIRYHVSKCNLATLKVQALEAYALEGDLPMLQWVYSMALWADLHPLCRNAAQGNHVHVLEWLFQTIPHDDNAPKYCRITI